MRIDLDEIVEAIRYSTNGVTHFLNIKNGDIIMQNENFSRSEYNDVEDLLDQNWENIIEIPTNYDADSFGMMKDFIWDLPRGQAKDALKVAIRGQGAFGRFREVCRNFGLLEEWRQYEDQEYARFAREWCEENQIAFHEKVRVVYTHALPDDTGKLVALKHKELGIPEEDGLLDFEMERYFNAQLRKGDLYQIIVSSRDEARATGGIQWLFVPPTKENPAGREGRLVNFYVDPLLKEEGVEDEILNRLAGEAVRRHISLVQVPESLMATTTKLGWEKQGVLNILAVKEEK